MAVKKGKIRERDIKEKVRAFLDSERIEAQVTKIVLAGLFLTGVVFVAAAAPNTFSAFGRLFGKSKLSKEEFNQALFSLKRRGFVKIIKYNNGNRVVRITSKGKSRVRFFCLEALEIPKQRRWDGQWRVIIFDIPNNIAKGRARGAFRETLKDLGFFQVQKSVWIHPYPCEDEVLFAANIWGVEKYIEMFIAQNFLYEGEMKKHFKLS